CRPHTITCTHLFFSHCYGDHRDLHSFPTRRSSDLQYSGLTRPKRCLETQCDSDASFRYLMSSARVIDASVNVWSGVAVDGATLRSEEHTSELQSRENLVCRLLLEKKNKDKNKAATK